MRTFFVCQHSKQVFLNLCEGHSLHKFECLDQNDLTEEGHFDPISYQYALGDASQAYKSDFWSHAVLPNGYILLLCFDGLVKLYAPGDAENKKVEIIQDDTIEHCNRSEEFEAIQFVEFREEN